MNRLVCCFVIGLLSSTFCGHLVSAERLSEILTYPDRPRPHYIVHFMEQEPILCDFFEEDKEEGKITFSVSGTKIKQKQNNNRLERVEKKITPSELVVGRGAELLAATKHKHLHLDIQRELLKLIKWGVATDAVQFGKEEVPAPKKECADLVIKAAQAFPNNKDILNAMRGILTDQDDDRLEQALIEGVKNAERWDKGYLGIAEILEKEGRDQQLLPFVRKWVEKHKGSIDANKWALRIALLNNDTTMAKEAARRLWLRNEEPSAGAEYATILLMENKVDEALKIANDVLEIDPTFEEMKIIVGSALLAKGELEEASRLLTQASNSSNESLSLMAKHNLGVLNWRQGKLREARKYWVDSDHLATKLAKSIANKRAINDPEVMGHPAMAMTARELNAIVALEQENASEALLQLRPNHSQRHAFLKRVAELIQTNYSMQSIKILDGTSTEESVLWRAYAYIQLGQFSKAEALMQDLPKDHGYASVYRVYCAEGLGEPQRAEALFQIAKKANNAPAAYVSELESHYLTMKSSKELEQFKWPQGDRLKTGWFSEAPKTGIHIFASGEYLAFSGTQKEQAVSRAWRKRSKERLRKIRAKIEPSQGWNGLEMTDNKAQNGLAVALELIGEDKNLVWRSLTEGKWGDWITIGPFKENTLTLLLDDSLVGDEQIQITNGQGKLVPLASLSDIPGAHMRVGFFTYAPSETEVNLKIRELLFEVRPQ